MSTTTITTAEPRTGAVADTTFVASSTADVDAVVRRADVALAGWQALGRAGRGAALRAVAEAYEAHADELVALADRETGLGATRLAGDLARTCYQLRVFADVSDEGSYLEATIDHATDTAMGPRPDLRRLLVPIGVVAVFGASNSPFAYSVTGGDTASALTSGCTVVVKAHPAHPGLSQRCADLAAAALESSGAPEGTLGLVHGQDAGADLVRHPAVKAVGFTGSLRGGRFLHDLAAGRPDPIPFYGELGSINPLVVTDAAAAARPTEIAAGLVGAITTAMGQACTKPGLVFVPATAAGEGLLAAISSALTDSVPGWLLTDGIRAAYESGIAEMQGLPGVTVLGTGPVQDGGFSVPATALAVPAAELDGRLFEECFGPAVVAVTYDSEAELLKALETIEGSLTGTIHHEGDADVPLRVVEVLATRVGRLVWNAFPTGLPIAWATQHGGPFPASMPSIHTSVGPTSMRRFLRPITWQDAPQVALPRELLDGPSDLPRRVDGVLVPAPVTVTDGSAR